MKKTNAVLLFLLIATLSGCAIPTRENLLEAWMGHQESELVASLGEPDTTVRNREGMRILTWDDRGCNKSFVVDNTGEVVNWTDTCAAS